MRIYRAKISPESSFLTPLKGDTLFGQICWAIFHRYKEERLKELLKDYESTPFLIVSDAFPIGYLPKPTMPMERLKEDPKEKKQNRKKRWLSIDDFKKGEFKLAKEDKDIDAIESITTTIHNSINYQTFQTGEGFTPYVIEERVINEREIYFLVDTNRFLESELEEVLKLIGEIGFGKKSTIGKGLFNLKEFKEFKEFDSNKESRTYMALSPFVVQGSKASKIYYEPFTRFGRHGDKRAKRAIKKPVIMADRGAVLEYEQEIFKLYEGRGLRGVSLAYSDTVHQGYTILFPIKGI